MVLATYGSPRHSAATGRTAIFLLAKQDSACLSMTSTVTEAALRFICQRPQTRGETGQSGPPAQEAGSTVLLRTARASLDAGTPSIQTSLSPVLTPAFSAGPSATVLSVYPPFSPADTRQRRSRTLRPNRRRHVGRVTFHGDAHPQAVVRVPDDVAEPGSGPAVPFGGPSQSLQVHAGLFCLERS